LAITRLNFISRRPFFSGGPFSRVLRLFFCLPRLSYPREPLSMSKLSQWAKSVAILDILAGLLALQVLLILYFGGFSYLIFKTRLTFPQYAGTLIVLLLVLIFRVLIRSGFSYSKINPAQKSFLIFAVIMIVYLGNHRTLDAVDTIPARYLPVSIIRTGDLNLDEYNFLHRYGTPPFLKEVGGHYVSDYP